MSLYELRTLYIETLLYAPSLITRHLLFRLTNLATYHWYVTCTATLSSEKSRAVDVATSTIRIMKLAFVRSAKPQVRPHVSVGYPKYTKLSSLSGLAFFASPSSSLYLHSTKAAHTYLVQRSCCRPLRQDLLQFL